MTLVKAKNVLNLPGSIIIQINFCRSFILWSISTNSLNDGVRKKTSGSSINGFCLKIIFTEMVKTDIWVSALS